MLLPLGREAAYLAFEGLEVRVLHGVCLEVLTLRRPCKTANTAELRDTGESFTLRPLSSSSSQNASGHGRQAGGGERTVGAARVRAGERFFPAVGPLVPGHVGAARRHVVAARNLRRINRVSRHESLRRKCADAPDI